MASNPNKEASIIQRDQAVFQSRYYNRPDRINVVARPVNSFTGADASAGSFLGGLSDSLKNLTNSYISLQDSQRAGNVAQATMDANQIEDVYNKPLSFLNIGAGYDDTYYKIRGANKAKSVSMNIDSALKDMDYFRHIRAGAVDVPATDSSPAILFTPETARATRAQLFEEIYNTAVNDALGTNDTDWREQVSASPILQGVRSSLVTIEAEESLKIAREEKLTIISEGIASNIASLSVNPVSTQADISAMVQQSFSDYAPAIISDGYGVIVSRDAADTNIISTLGTLAYNSANTGNNKTALGIIDGLLTATGSNGLPYYGMKNSDGTYKFKNQIDDHIATVSKVMKDKLENDKLNTVNNLLMEVFNIDETDVPSAKLGQAKVNQAYAEGLLSDTDYRLFTNRLDNIKYGGGYATSSDFSVYSGLLSVVNDTRIPTYDKIKSIQDNVLRGNLTQVDSKSLAREVLAVEERLNRQAAGDTALANQIRTSRNSFITDMESDARRLIVSNLAGATGDIASIMSPVAFNQNSIYAAIRPQIANYVNRYANWYLSENPDKVGQNIYETDIDFRNGAHKLIMDELINPVLPKARSTEIGSSVDMDTLTIDAITNLRSLNINDFRDLTYGDIQPIGSPMPITTPIGAQEQYNIDLTRRQLPQQPAESPIYDGLGNAAVLGASVMHMPTVSESNIDKLVDDLLKDL